MSDDIIVTLDKRVHALEETAAAAVRDKTHALIKDVDDGIHDRFDKLEKHVTATIKHWTTPAVSFVLGVAVGIAATAIIVRLSHAL